MNGYFYPTPDAADQREAIQSALDEARALGRGTVVIEGDRTVDGTLYIGDYTTVVLKDGVLNTTNKELPLFKNYNTLLPRGRTLYGMQTGISIIGDGATLKGRIELTNVIDFTLEGLTFTEVGCGISLAYATGGRLIDLKFRDVGRCIDCGIGTRNCYFDGIEALGESDSITFSSERISGRVVYYFGPDTKNNIVRGLRSSTAITISGEWCQDIITENS